MLIVEDDQACALSLTELMQLEGFNVQLAGIDIYFSKPLDVSQLREALKTYEQELWE